MLDYKLIEAIAMVIEEGGFDKAAKRLHLTQSAVSQRVRLLEEQTGRILLVRGNPPCPTSFGTRLLKHYLQVKRLEGDLGSSLSSDAETQLESLSIGLNADSLETWFLDRVEPFLKNHPVTLDLKVDDQEQTHKMLRNGEVAGCISARKAPVQGCTVTGIGIMNYRLTASPEFTERYFPDGITMRAVRAAPAVLFNRKDNLHQTVLKKIFTQPLPVFPVHYIPSTEKFAALIIRSHAYGVIPDEQSKKLIQSGDLIDLAPEHHIPVDLFWHCWNLKSQLLDQFTTALKTGEKK